MRRWLGVVIAVAACKDHKQAAAPPAPKAVVVADAAAAVPAKKTLSKDQLAAYRKHMKAGWALQKQQKWAESVPELEAAVKALEGDERALAELGWSAMNAGDYKKARRADDQAVRVAIDPKVKASALFNLGMVEAKTGNADDARDSFTRSLALRPNATVAGELAKLGAAPEVEKPFCPAGTDPCTCVNEDAFPGTEAEGDDAPQCAATNEPAIPVPTFKSYATHWGAWSHTYVLDEHDNFVAESTRADDRMRHSEELGIEKAEVKTIGSHKVLWLQTRDHSAEETPHDDDTIDESLDDLVEVTLCVIGDATTPTRCPLRSVPIEHTATGAAGTGPEVTVTTKLDLAIAADGTATLKLVSGPSDARMNALIGPHKLF